MTQNATLSAKNKVVCVYVVVCFFFNIFGVIKLGWDIAEMTGLFLVMSTRRRAEGPGLRQLEGRCL